MFLMNWDILGYCPQIPILLKELRHMRDQSTMMKGSMSEQRVLTGHEEATPKMIARYAILWTENIAAGDMDTDESKTVCLDLRVG
jgi:hypothetical protein